MKIPWDGGKRGFSRHSLAVHGVDDNLKVVTAAMGLEGWVGVNFSGGFGF
jgi:hypothetical protein